jgi:PAS domain S-box-containing protein
MSAPNRNEEGLPPPASSLADLLDAPLLEPLAALPLAAVSAEGEVTHVNEAGVAAWGRLDGLRLPTEVVSALRQQEAQGLVPLAEPIGGLRVLSARHPAGGWLLVGYAGCGGEGEAPTDPLAEEAAVALLRLRADGVVTYANAEAEALTGLARAEMLGRTFGVELLYPEDRHRLTAALREARQSGRAEARVRLRAADGALRRVELRLSGGGGDAAAVLLDVTEHDEMTSALLQSEALYQTFLEQSPIAILHLDAEGVVTFENYQLRAITGEDPEDAWIGRPLAEVPGLDPRLADLVGGLLERGRSFGEGDLEYAPRGASPRLLAVHGAPICHPEQGIVGAALMVFDVTEERSRQRELEARRRYDAAEAGLRRAALTASSEHTLYEQGLRLLGETAHADAAFLLLPAEDGLEEDARWTREPERSLVPLRLAGPPEAAYAEAGAPSPLLQATSADEALAVPLRLSPERRGLLVLARSGSARWYPPEREGIAQGAVLLETLGSWVRAEARYRQVVDSIEDALFACTFEEGRRAFSFLARQVETLTGYPCEAFLEGEVGWTDRVVHEEDRAAVEAHERALRDGRESRLAYRIVRRDGAVRWLREGAAPHREAGRLTVAGILSDITEQKEGEASLMQAKLDAEAANRLKSSFLATMSHELRTPLGAIKGFAELLEEEVQGLNAPPDEVIEFAGVIRANAAKVLRLVSDLLDLARLQTDRLALACTPVPLRPLVSASAARHEAALAVRGVALRLDLPEPDPIVLADARRLDQVVEILLSNAVKFTEAGHVLIRAEAHPEGIRLHVEDTGIGIAEDYLPRIFEPLSQEDNRLNREYEGSGLGLALAQRLVEAMGGTLAVESRKGEGATFTVALPRADA